MLDFRCPAFKHHSTLLSPPILLITDPVVFSVRVTHEIVSEFETFETKNAFTIK